MDKSIKENKNKLVFILLIFTTSILLSCSVLKKVEDKFKIGLSSVYDNDKCTLIINGKTYLNNKPIITERSLGIDLKNGVSIKSEKLNMNITFDAIIDKGLDIKRSIKLDTILYLKNGYNVLISARSENVEITQQSKPFVLD